MRILVPINSKTAMLRSAPSSEKLLGQACADVNMINSCIVWKNNKFLFRNCSYFHLYLNKVVSQTTQPRFVPTNKYKLKYLMLIILLPKLKCLTYSPHEFPGQPWIIRAWNIKVKCLWFHRLMKWLTLFKRRKVKSWPWDGIEAIYEFFFLSPPLEYLVILL